MACNAAAMALSEYARTRGLYPVSGIPANRYEAEDATVRSLGLEDRYAGFSGWGYVAGWNRDGQWVAFHPKVAAGAHRLTFRYAAAAEDARRLILINGRPIGPFQRFPGTGSWSVYRTISLPYRLRAGVNDVTVIYDLAKGSRNYLNMDRLEVD